ncbi:S9 family peptidase [Wenzhouxiangella sp. AB-CW3]|nr:S9 family peptidase [Wenzhouxiangella sp. AB-CW3]
MSVLLLPILCVFVLSPLAADESDVLAAEALLQYETAGDPQVSPDGSQIVYTRRWVDDRKDRWQTALWVMDADGERQRFLAEGSSPRWSPDGTRILYLAEDDEESTQLFVRWMDAEGATSQITRLDERPRDPQWTPDGKQIVFGALVPEPTTWEVSMPSPPSGASWTEGPRVIDDLHYRQDFQGFMDRGFMHLFQVSANGGAVRQLTSGEWNVGSRFDGLVGSVNFSFTPDGQSIVFDGWKGDWDSVYRRSHLYALDRASGDIRQITEEVGFWTNPVVSPDGRRVAFLGYPDQPDTYSQPYLHVIDLDGSNKRNLTEDLDRLVSNVHWASDSRGVYAVVTHHGTRNIRHIPLSGAIRDITDGHHLVSLTSVADVRRPFGVGVRTGPQSPPDVVSFRLREGSQINQLTNLNDELFSTIELAEVEEFWTQSADGTDIHGWVVKPPNFDPEKQYPLLMEIHGGPFADYTAGFNFNYQVWAGMGYLVLYTNPRGSTSYGEEFARGINFRYPGVDHEDLMAFVDEMVDRDWVDTSRKYVGGCSGGGVLSSWMIGHTDRFAAAAVRCPVTNWMSMFGTTDIPFFTQSFFKEPFWEDPTRWLEQSPIMYVGNVTTPTLLMTGELDLRTPMTQTEEYFAALKVLDVPVRMLRFREEFHGTGRTRPSNAIRTLLYMDDWYSQWQRVDGEAVKSEQ